MHTICGAQTAHLLSQLVLLLRGRVQLSLQLDHSLLQPLQSATAVPFVGIVFVAAKIIQAARCCLLWLGCQAPLVCAAGVRLFRLSSKSVPPTSASRLFGALNSPHLRLRRSRRGRSCVHPPVLRVNVLWLRDRRQCSRSCAGRPSYRRSTAFNGPHIQNNTVCRERGRREGRSSVHVVDF